MNIVKDLELTVDTYISKSIILYKRKNSDVKFISYKEGIVDKNNEAYYLTAIKKDILSDFLDRKINIYTVLSSSPVLFYAVSSINNKECLYLHKVKIEDVVITDDMKSLEPLHVCDKIKDKNQKALDNELKKQEIYISTTENDNEYLHDTPIYSNNVDEEDNLLSDDIVYKIDDEEEDEDVSYIDNDNDSDDTSSDDEDDMED